MFLLLKEVLFGAGGVTLVSFGVLAVHWNIREVVAYKTGIGKKVRVVKGVTGNENREIRQTNKLEPVGKVQFSVAGVESAEQGGTKLEVAQEESYIYTQAVVGGIDEAIQGMLDKQDTDSSKEAVVVDVATGLLEDIDVDVYEGTNVLVDETELNLDDSTQVLVDNEQDVVEEDVVEEVEIDDISESTDVLADLDDSTQVLDNDTTDDSEDYFTEVLDAEPQVEDVEITQVLNDNGLGNEYLTQVLVDDSDVVGIEDDFDDTLEDVGLEYVTQVLNEVDNSSDVVEVLEDDAYVTQVLVDDNDEVDYNTQVLVDEEDYNTQVLVDNDDYDTQVLVEDLEGHTQVLDNEGITGDIVGAKVETVDLVKVENMKVIYTNYEMEDK